jgi:hypothetical protein
MTKNDILKIKLCNYYEVKEKITEDIPQCQKYKLEDELYSIIFKISGILNLERELIIPMLNIPYEGLPDINEMTRDLVILAVCAGKIKGNQ